MGTSDTISTLPLLRERIGIDTLLLPHEHNQSFCTDWIFLTSCLIFFILMPEFLDTPLNFIPEVPSAASLPRIPLSVEP